MKKIVILILSIVLLTACNNKRDTEYEDMSENLHKMLANEISIYESLEDYEFDIKIFEMRYNLAFIKFDYEFTEKYIDTDDYGEKYEILEEANELKLQMMAIRRELVNTEPFNVEKAKKTIKLFEDFVIEYKTK